MATIELPTYNFRFHSPITGYGNFTFKHNPFLKCEVPQDVIDRKLALWAQIAASDTLANGGSNPNCTAGCKPGAERCGDCTREWLAYLKAMSLLKDKSIMAYAYFKFDNIPMRMRWYQDALLSDRHDRIIFCGGNQLGKSLTLNVDAATEFITDHGKGWVGLLVSNSLDQSEYQMSRIKHMLKSARINYRDEETTETKTGKKDNSTQISFTFYDTDGKTPLYTNLLICCPHTSSALGYPADDLWLDEFDWWENVKGGQRHFMYQVIMPRTFETKGRVKIYTNFNGKDHMAWELWNQVGEDGQPVWHRYNFNYWDKPGATQEDFNKKKIGMTRQQIDSTLLAIASQSEGAFLSFDEIEDQIDPELCEKGDQAGYGKETAWFLDVGSVHDQSVLVGAYVSENPKEKDIPIINVFWVHKYPVGYPISRVLGVEQKVVQKGEGEDLEWEIVPMDKDDGWADYAEKNPSVREVLTEFGTEIGGKVTFPLFGYDATGNSGLMPLLQSIGIDPIDVVFSGPRKWAMYQRYQYYSQNRYLKRARDRDENAVVVGGIPSDFSYQAGKLIIKKGTKTSYRQIHHENEDDLDDTQDAVVGVIKIIEDPDMPSLSFSIIENKRVPSLTSDAQPGQDELKDTQIQEEDERLKGQYIPSFMREGISGFLDDKEARYH